MPTVELVKLFRKVSQKPEPRAHGQRILREFLLRELEKELLRRAQVAALLHGIAEVR